MRNVISKSMILPLIIILFFCSATMAEETMKCAANVTDDLERVVNVAGVPERIVSLSLSNTEILFPLGLADRIIGVTKYYNYSSSGKGTQR
jgi:ABC-type Fe3+-hydroxamate transport system substrate-binding protein